MNEQGPPGGALIQLAPFILIIAAFYFLILRPQQTKARQTKAMLDGLKPGDQVITNGGIYGKVVKLQETEVSLEIAPNVRIRLERPSVGQLVDSKKLVDNKKAEGGKG